MRHVAAHSPAESAAFPTARLREEFLVSDLFQAGTIQLVWWETDRTIIGGVCPTAAPLALAAPPEMRATFFCERREIGLVNLGGPGLIRADGMEYRLDALDALYLGRGLRDVTFASASAAKPARFYFLS